MDLVECRNVSGIDNNTYLHLCYVHGILELKYTIIMCLRLKNFFFIFFKHKKLFWMLKSLEMGIVDNNLFKTILTFFVRQTETISDTNFTVLIKCMKNSLF